MKKLIMTLMLMPMMAWASLTDGLVAYYPFDGNANDASGNGNHGTTHGVTLTTDRFGNANSAYHFDGVDDWIQIADSQTLMSLTNGLTFSAWICIDEWRTWEPIFCKAITTGWNADHSGYEDALYDFKYTFGAYFEGLDMPLVSLSDCPVASVWTHVTLTFNGNKVIVYHNGEESGSGTGGSFNSTVPNEPLVLGRDAPGDNEWLNGSMDEVRFYNRALSAAEVKALYDGTAVTPMPSPVPIDGLVAYYPFDGNANDASGNGNHGTTHGVTLTADRFGNANGAYYFGDGNYILVPENNMLNSIEDYTLSVWLRVNSWYGWNACAPIAGKAEGNVRQFVSELVWAGTDMELGNNNGATTKLSVMVPSEEWVQITVTRRLDTSRVYMNGIEISSQSGTAGGVHTGDLEIGRESPYDVEYLVGAMDDMRLYNRALSAAEVMALYDGTAVTPTPVTYTVIFDLNGADGAAPAGRQIAHGDAVGGLPTVTRTGYAFLGWFTAASGGAQISASTAVTGNVTCYAQWRVNSYAMTFDANGGVGGTVKTQDYGTALTAPAVTRTGYTFTGWSPSVPSTVPAADATYTAQWLINSYTVTFDANGGTAGTSYMARNHGATLGSLPIPVRDGYEFLGWFTAASGGTQVYASTAVTGNVTYYAQWQEEENALWDEDEAFDAAAAAVFDGFLVKDGEVCGSIQVKAAKAGRNGAAKLAATVTRLGVAQKLSYKGMMGTSAASDDFTPGVATLTCSGQPNLMLRLGRNALWGEMGSYEIEGARNVFAKSGDPKAGALSKWLGAYTLVLETVDAAGSGSGFAWGYSGLTVTVGAKGKVKVQGTLVDGAKVNVASQLLVGDGRCCIPVVVPLYAKKGGFGFNLWLQEDGSIEAGEISKWDATVSKTPFTAWWGENVPVAKTGAALPASLSFMLAGEPDVAGMEVLYDFLPWEVVFATGARWTLPTAGNVKYDREADDYVDAKDSSNPSGLKLTYVAKMGTFKGSFKMYAVDASGRLKKYTANVSGVIVGRQGYGTASVKGVGSWPVLIE